MTKMIFLLAALLLLAVPGLMAQPEACPALVQAAYAAAALECADVPPGMACYGNAPLEVSALDSGSFRRPGDRIGGVQRLASGSMQTDAGAWGVAVLNVPANYPDQTITMIVLGGVIVENASPAQAPVVLANVRVAERVGLIVRAAPEENAERVGLLNFGDIVPATGRLPYLEWLRVALPNGGSGWVSALSVLPEGDVDALPVVSAADEPPQTFFSPLQALTLETAIEDSRCSAAPESGLLLQTSQPVTMQINDMTLQFDGTLYVQAPREFIVYVLEGSAQITLPDGKSETVWADWRARVRYDRPDQPGGAFRVPDQSPYFRLRPLPLNLLPRAVKDPAFNLIGVATPAPAERSPLEGMDASSPCTIAAVNEVRLRRGPGREYPILGALYPNESARPDARARGSDGAIWWRLPGEVWVSANVVLAVGMCSNTLPLVEAPPPPAAGEAG
jgi:hypothetical protein